jgi:hypothetical protein
VTNIHFVQFPHPGSEHRPGPDGTGKPWNWLKNPPTPKKPVGSDNPHRRTFLQLNGTRLTDDGPVHGPLWAWGEWEAEATVVRKLLNSDREPTTLFEPYWAPKDSFQNLHNTDPFVFDGFYYTDCKQGTSASLMGMLELDVGSVIVFGSGLSDGIADSWVLDAVLVVDDYVDHNVKNYKDKLNNRVPNGYEHVVLGPTYGEHASRRHLPRRLYIGATHDNPLHGMFSFFPCTAPLTDRGFARPEIKQNGILKDRFNPKLRQGVKGHGNRASPLSVDQIKILWANIRDQVMASGCDLGVWADMPKRRD